MAWKPKTSRRGFVSSEHFLATQAGLEMLRNGGNAFDAAAAVQLVLSVVQARARRARMMPTE